MKWIGALLIVTVTTWAGFDLANRFRKRPSHIRQWKNALQIIEAEMVYGRSSLREVCERLSEVLPKPIHLFFSEIAANSQPCDDFSSMWNEKLKQHWPSNTMSKTELEILMQFGATLGQHDLTSQQKQIQLTLHHLDRELNDALEAGDQYQKMARGMGILSGLLVIIIIL